MRAIVQAVDLRKQYANGVVAVEDVSLSIERGRFVALLGANGAGKTTFIHLACGILQPTSGTIEVDVASGADIGWCSQTQMIDWWASVLHNTLIGPRFARKSRSEARHLADAALELLDLSDMSTKSCSELSGGQLQRVQIARAIAHHPTLMFLDEPTVGLDASVAENVMQELVTRTRNGATVVCSSHELDVVERYCDDVLLIDDGALVAHVDRDAFVRTYATEEVADVTLAGEVADLAADLRSLACVRSVTGTNPYRIVITRGQSHLLLEKLMSVHRVTGFALDTPGLREAFMRYRQRQHGSADGEAGVHA